MNWLDMAWLDMAGMMHSRLWLQDPEAVHEPYKKGQHLKGLDAANAERVRAEMVCFPCMACTHTCTDTCHRALCPLRH